MKIPLRCGNAQSIKYPSHARASLLSEEAKYVQGRRKTARFLRPASLGEEATNMNIYPRPFHSRFHRKAKAGSTASKGPLPPFGRRGGTISRHPKDLIAGDSHAKPLSLPRQLWQQGSDDRKLGERRRRRRRYNLGNAKGKKEKRTPVKQGPRNPELQNMQRRW